MRAKIPEVLRSVSGIEWLVFGFNCIATVVSVRLYLHHRPALGVMADDLNTGVVLFVITWAAAVVMMLVSRQRIYHVAMSVRLISAFLLVVYSAPDLEIVMLLVVVLVSELGLYDPFPRNLVLGLCTVTATVALRSVSLARLYGIPWVSSLELEVLLIIVGCLVATLASLLIRWREELVDAEREVTRLDGMVTRLTEANLQSQDFASQVQEIAMDNERKRITRDIHDVVGYTLTNNIIMMEAAIDMVRRNSGGVPDLINVARDNAQEGLERIRESMYKLRSRTISHPTGLRAIARLLSVYQRATGVHVDSHFGSVRWGYSDEIDSAIYHFVQETLMNSFRHGKAQTVRLVIEEVAEGINMLVRDDGIGADGFNEGIGLKGIRERVSRLGGMVMAEATSDGFAVRGSIPLVRDDS